MNITIRQSEFQKKLVRAAFLATALSLLFYIGVYLSLVVGGLTFRKTIAETKAINTKIVKTETELSSIERSLHENTQLAYLKTVSDSEFLVRKDNNVTFSFLYEAR